MEDSSAALLGGALFCAGEMCGQELSGSVQCRGRLVEDRVVGLEDVGYTGGDVEGDLDVAGDILGRRRVFVSGLLLFAAASLFGGFATGQAWLLTARAVQGAGGAVIAPTGLALISTNFPQGQERNRAFRVYAAMAAAGAAAGLGPRPLIVAGAAMVAGGMFWYSRLTEHAVAGGPGPIQRREGGQPLPKPGTPPPVSIYNRHHPGPPPGTGRCRARAATGGTTARDCAAA